MTSSRAAGAVALTLLVAPAAMAGPVKVGRAMLTYYWVIDEHAAPYRGAPDAILCDAHGHVIERTSRRFRKALVLEGSGCLRDGRTVTYDHKVRGEHRFRVTKTKAGVAFNGCALEPFRTVAVDPRVIPLGSKIYIPQLKGSRLPDGTIHDGIFIAADRGHFRGHRIDIFVGEGARGARPFTRRGYTSRSHVTVYLMR